MALGFEPEDRDEVRGVDQGFVFGSLVGSKVALVCAFTKHFDPRQHLWIDSERHQTPSRFRVETEAQRLQKTIESATGVHASTLSQEENDSGMHPAKSGHRHRRSQPAKINSKFAHPQSLQRPSADPIPALGKPRTRFPDRPWYLSIGYKP